METAQHLGVYYKSDTVKVSGYGFSIFLVIINLYIIGHTLYQWAWERVIMLPILLGVSGILIGVVSRLLVEASMSRNGTVKLKTVFFQNEIPIHEIEEVYISPPSLL